MRGAARERSAGQACSRSRASSSRRRSISAAASVKNDPGVSYMPRSLSLVIALALLLTPAEAYAQSGGGVDGRGWISIAISVGTFIGRLFGLGSGGVSRDVKRALDGISGVIVDIGRALREFLRDTAMVFATVWAFLRKFWDRVLLPLLRRLDDVLLRITKWLRDTFGPIIEFLQAVRRELLRFYDRWLRPIFDTIDVLRRILGIFSLFGLEWSRRLDRALAEIQDAMALAFSRVVGELNRITGVVDRIVDLDGLLQRLTLLRSVERDIAYIWRAHRNAQSKPLTDAERAAARAQGKWPTGEEWHRDSVSYFRGGPSVHDASIREWAAELDLQLRRGA